MFNLLVYRIRGARKPIPTVARAKGSLRKAGRMAAIKWWEKFCLLHYDMDNRNRYNFLPRSGRYQRIKNRGWFRDRHGVKVILARPPADLIWRGRLRDAAKEQRSAAIGSDPASNNKNIKAIVVGGGTLSAGWTMELPHRMRSRNIVEVTLTNEDENRELFELITKEFFQFLENWIEKGITS